MANDHSFLPLCPPYLITSHLGTDSTLHEVERAEFTPRGCFFHPGSRVSSLFPLPTQRHTLNCTLDPGPPSEVPPSPLPTP
jgi:hypothetical protein